MIEKLLKQARDDHGLTSIGVNIFGRSPNDYVTVYVHWGDDGCVGRDGKTFDEALAKAVAEMGNQRANRDEADYLDHQQSLMESGGRDDSAYRRDMVAAGRGHLIGGAS